MKTVKVLGRCHCGYLKFQSKSPATRPCFCHCQSCRTSTGAPYMAWVEIDSKSFSLSQGQLAKYQSSQGVTRGFCPKCGMSLTYQSSNNREVIDVALTAIQDTKNLIPERHIWISDKVPWVRLNDGLPQFDEWSD